MEKLLAGAARLVRGSTMPTESNSKARIFTVAGINVAHLREYMVNI
jgi:hypothetical protein